MIRIKKMRSPLRAALSRTAEGRKIIASLHLAGTSPELLGKGFWKKVGKGLSTVGKYTGRVTGNIAKVAAGLVGIPPSAIDALAKIDPTTHKKLISSVMNTPAGTQAAAIVAADQNKPGLFQNIKPAYIVAGAAGLVAVVFLVSRKK